MFGLYSWGANSHGQLGLGYESEQCSSPQLLQTDGSVDLETIQKMKGGGGHLLMLDKIGRMYACGWNSKGQLGLCHTNDSFVITPLKGTESPIVDISCGWDSSAAIDAKGDIYVWGSNAFDQLGYSAQFIDTQFSFPMLLNLPLNEKAKQVCFGLRYMCILCDSQNIYIVGRWRYQDNCKIITHNNTNFYQLSAPSNIEHISSGASHVVCVYKDSSGARSLIGFGDNKFMQSNEIQLGDVDVDCLRSGWSHNAFLTTNGSVFLWGRNTYGQLANSDCDRMGELTELKGIDGKIQQLHLGSEHGLVVTENNAVFTWGWNEHGNCGNGSDTNLYEPYQVPISGKCRLSVAGAGFCFVLVEKLIE